jgi:hypothetical protein
MRKTFNFPGSYLVLTPASLSPRSKPRSSISGVQTTHLQSGLNVPGVFERKWLSVMTRVVEWRTFWALLQMRSFSYISQIKCLQTHVDMDSFLLFRHLFIVAKACPHLPLTLCILYTLFSPLPASSRASILFYIHQLTSLISLSRFNLM